MGEEVFKLLGVFALKGKEDVDKGIDDATKHAEKGSSKIKKAFEVVGKAIVAGTVAIGAATIKFTKDSIKAYADYEQLAGGSQLLFGDAYDFVAEKAKKAYSTVQLSQNDYLKQVNGFATGLKTSLGGNVQAAAELADKIVQAEADVVAATGNTQENVQNAFNGIMKSNYTMLDNLQLGIKPTKEGMQEVIDKVNDWNKANGNATKYQIDNLADCQSALVDYIKMQGLAGYAANEAAGTIQGSWTSLKGSWQNLLVGFADGNQDINELIRNTVDSAGKVFNNIIPRVKQVLKGVKQVLSELLQKTSEKLPEFIANIIGKIDSMLPNFLEEGAKLIKTLLNGLTNNLPAIVQGGIHIVSSLIIGIAQQLPSLIPMAVNLIITLVMSLLDNIDQLIDAGISLIMGLADGIIEALPILIEKAPEIIEKLISALVRNFPKIVKAGGELIGKLVAGLIGSIYKLLEVAPKIVSNLVDGIKNLWGEMKNAGKYLIEGLWSGINNAKQWVLDKIKGFGDSILKGIKSFFGIHSPSTLFRDEVGKFMAQGIGVGFSDEMKDVTKQMQNAVPTKFEIDNEAYNQTKSRAYVGNTRYSDSRSYLGNIGYTYSRQEGLLEKLIDILLAYFPQFKELMNQPLVADDGTIIARYAPMFNDELKRIDDKERRGS